VILFETRSIEVTNFHKGSPHETGHLQHHFIPSHTTFDPMSIPRHRALAILNLCVGDEIWNEETCHRSGVPQDWIHEMSDAIESGYKTDTETIYVANEATNQYHGLRDLDLAIRLGQVLGVDVERATQSSISRRSMVQAIKNAVFDGD
jgi:hypothetical protein